MSSLPPNTSAHAPAEGQPAAQPTAPPPGGQRPPNQPAMRIRRPKADPLVRPKRRPPPRPMQPGRPTQPGQPGQPTSGPPPQPNAARPTTSTYLRPPARNIAPADDMSVNGFTGPLLSETCTDYPVVTTKRALLEGLRHNIARFASKKDIDLRDESQFTRPVRLQRRDPRANVTEPPAQEKEKPVKGSLANLTEAEREELEARKAVRDKEKEESMAQIAPSAANTQKRSQAPKQRTQQVFKAEMTSEELARARVKYEEALPWHLEDFDNKSCWVGNYEAAMSETYCMFVPQADGKMRMVPIDKWYKFTAKHTFRPLTIEEAERYMSKRVRDPVWLMHKEQDRANQKAMERYSRQGKLYTGKLDRSAVDTFEGDEMDFEEDRFADDEEHVEMYGEEDEDTKLAEERIKKDQLKANIFDLKDEKAYEQEELKEQREKEALKSYGKKVRKALQKREKNFDYSSGSEANPYSEESSTESEDEEEKKRKEEEEQKQKDKDKPAGTAAKEPAPTGRPKAAETSKKGTTASGVSAKKRMENQDMSDASGTDTSKKKAGKKTGAVSQPPSRPMSPAVGAQPAAAPNKKRARVGGQGAASGSDVERGAGSGGEMSDNGASKKLRLNPPSGGGSPVSRNGSPFGSRAGSPVPAAQRATSVSSPQTGAAGGGTPPPSNMPFPTFAEVHASIPPTGISSAELLRIFRPRLGDSRQNQAKFIAVVKEVSVYGKDRLLRPGQLKPSQLGQ